MANLTNLKALHASFNHISDFRPLQGITGLTISYGNQVIIRDKPVYVDRNNNQATLESNIYLVDGTEVKLEPNVRVGEPVWFNSNSFAYGYRWYFNGATGGDYGSNGSLIYTGLKEQEPGITGEFNNTTVVPMDNKYFLTGSYTESGIINFAVIQPYILTETAGPITVKYQDENGKELHADTTLTGMIDENYTAEPLDIENYELVTTPDNASGTFTADGQTVTFVYRRMDAGNLTFKYQDQNGDPLAPDKTVSGQGQLGESFDEAAPTIDNYKTPANASGTFTKDGQTFIFVYLRQDAADVTIKHQDEAGNQLADDRVLNGHGQLGNDIGDWREDIPNYELVRVDGAKTFGASAETVTYVYRRKDAGDVTIKYQDENGNPLADDRQLAGKGQLGLEIPDQQQDIAGYQFVTIKKQAVGTFTEDAQTIIYVYRRTAGEAVTVKYQDVNGKQLHADTTLSGAIGESYTSQPLAITGYRLKTVIGQPSGTFGEQAQTITYVYEADLPVTPVENGKVTVQYVTRDGKVLKTSTLTGKVGNAYTTSALDFNGYQLVTTPDNANGTFTNGALTVTYVYQAVTTGGGETPTDPDKPDKPQPETPAPDKVDPQPETPQQPAGNGQTDPIKAGSAFTQLQNQPAKAGTALPQTNEAQSARTGLLGLALAGLTTAFGWLTFRKRRS
nr:MucBP domain-containing protein [Lactiplantibacillus plajomi]